MSAVASVPSPSVPVIGPENALLRFSLSHFPGCADCLSLDRRETNLPAYSPLVLVGETGSGKTEFLNFVARRWCESAGFSESDVEASRRVARWTGRGLAAELQSGLEHDSLHKLHARFRAAELLLVDGLDECHEAELLNLFSALLDQTAGAGGQVIVSLSLLPGESASFPRSLVTRLSEGLIVKVHPPEQQSRKDIVRFLARRRGMQIDEAAIGRLASRESDSGSLDKTLAVLASDGVDRIESRHVLGVLEHSSGRSISPRRIITMTARHHGLRFEDLVGLSRHRQVSHARSMAIYLIRRLTGKSLVEIGECFGGRDHTTVLHSVRVVKKRYESDPGCRRAVEGILSRLSDSILSKRPLSPDP